ncbi:MAG TPA: response regulator transcription factor [Bacillales bacterium]|nr:response regulator transcription factor [Bacillales bacterium]
MALSLDRQLKAVLQTGLDLVRSHRNFIEDEWAAMRAQVREHGGKTAAAMETGIDFFANHFFSEPAEDANVFFIKLEESACTVDARFHPNHVIFVVTMLENAVHRAVSGDTGADSRRNHQAVQFLFGQIGELLLSTPFHEQVNITRLVEQLVSSRQLPVDWVARAKQRHSRYEVTAIIGPDGLCRRETPLAAESVFLLSEKLLAAFPSSSTKERHVLPVPWREETLLIGTSGQDAASLLPFLTFVLQIHAAGESMRQFTQQKQQWKDAVRLFNNWIMPAGTLREALEKVTQGFVNYLPFERCALFAYSDDDRTGSGLFGCELNADEIRRIKLPIEHVPLLEKNLKNLLPHDHHMRLWQPIYIPSAEEAFPLQYVRKFQLKTVVVAPVYVPSENKLIGAVVLDQGPEKSFKMPRETFMALMHFGQSAGELLTKYGGDEPERTRTSFSYQLSQRELDVLKLMADGATTTEAAEHLHLSEYTVRDYVSTIMQKMNARNRTEAAVRAVRNGLI